MKTWLTIGVVVAVGIIAIRAMNKDDDKSSFSSACGCGG